MKNIKTFLLASIVMLLSVQAEAQNYNTAVGIKFAWGTAITAKKFIKDNTAIELIANYKSYNSSFLTEDYNWSRIRITGLYEIYAGLDNLAPGLAWYYGGGAFVGFYSGNFDFDGSDDSSFFVGISGVVGLDYKFADYPINISTDWVPSFSFSGRSNGFTGESGGLAVRYTF